MCYYFIDTNATSPRFLNFKQYIRKRRNFYLSNFTLHGLSNLLGRSLYEKVFWAVSMLTLLGCAGYMASKYTKRYFAYEIRTEIRFQESQITALPTIVLCLESTFKEDMNCYRNKSFVSKRPCKEKIRNTIAYYQVGLEGPGMTATNLGRDCHVINENGSDAISSKIGQLNVQFFTTDMINASLMVYLTTPEEFKASKESHHVLQYGFDIRITLLGTARKIMLEKSEIARLPKPYTNNCTESKEAPNRFSSIYTKFSCQEECLFTHMYKECGDVADIFKKYLSQPVQIFRNDRFSSRDECIHTLLLEAISGFLPYCQCSLACKETIYEVNRVDFINLPTHRNSWHLVFSYAKNEVTEIQEVADYPLEDFLGAFGGILGLALGASILSLVELLVYCFSTIVYCASKVRDNAI